MSVVFPAVVYVGLLSKDIAAMTLEMSFVVMETGKSKRWKGRHTLGFIDDLADVVVCH